MADQTRSRITPVLLCGGSGTRLWPLSRTSFPKQFLPLFSERSMLQDTAARLQDGLRFHAPIAICNHEHRFLVLEQLRQAAIDPSKVILEPTSRGTAPAVTVAALVLADRDPEAQLLVLPSDHVIRHSDAFKSGIDAAARAAQKGALATFGITPNAPETGYGYIRQGTPIEDAPDCFTIERFIEKPDRRKAEQLLSDGTCLWNSGMFLFRATVYLEELKRLRPDIYQACVQAVTRGAEQSNFLELAPDSFAACANISIDHAVMEHTARGAVVPVDIGWSDVGSWSELWKIGDKTNQGNVEHGNVLTENTRESYVRSDGPLVATIGMMETIVVATPDAVLVAPAARAQDVKLIVERLAAEKRPEATTHRVTHRPWGQFQDVDSGDGFHVKRLVVNPGAKLSLQMHRHRAEHWVVVKGTARVTRGEATFLLQENQSTYIPVGVVHRLENPGQSPLHIVEVQYGDYIGEDDITRLDDSYGRQ